MLKFENNCVSRLSGADEEEAAQILGDVLPKGHLRLFSEPPENPWWVPCFLFLSVWKNYS